MNDKNHTLDAISKATVIVPLIILVFALVFKADEYKSGREVKNVPVISAPIASPTPYSPVDSAPVAKSILNTKGPLYCEINNPESDVEVSILDSNIHVLFVSETKDLNVLITGDCGYLVENKERNGTKICGLDQYRGLLSMFNMSDSISIETLLSFVPMLSSSDAISNIDLKSLEQTCVEQEVDESLFVPLASVTYSEKSIEDFISESIGVTTPNQN